MIIGLMGAAIVSGPLISKTGRHKRYPILDTSVMIIAALLLSTMDPGTSLITICVYLSLLGTGVGLLMQNPVLAVQNAFPA